MGQGNGFPKTRSTEVKGRVGGGILGNGWSTFLLQKRPSPTLFTGIYKTRICVFVLMILFSKVRFNELLPKLPRGW